VTTNATAQPAPDRERIVEYLGAQLIGPIGGPGETLHDPPSKRYLMGLLFPQRADMEEVMDGDVFDGSTEVGHDEAVDDPVVLSSQHMPSSVGLSFLLPGGSPLTASISAAIYEPNGKQWQHRDVADDSDPILLEPADEAGLQRMPVLGGRAEITSRWRPHGGDHLVTVALVNTAEKTENNRIDESAVLCQVRVECTAESFLPYPTAGGGALDDEDAEQAFLYRNVPTYAVGHGCAADWDATPEADPTRIRTEFLPSEVLPDINFDIDGHDEVRDLRRLAEIDGSPGEIIEQLQRFADSYRNWIETTINGTNPPAHLVGARDRIADRLNRAADRIDEGISLLGDTSPKGGRVRWAFALANRAMLMQMHHSRNVAAARHTRAEATDPTCDYDNVGPFSWRPFQLAFLLMTLPSVTDPDHPDHDTVDLIWFPTGGGKTEAYLGLVAYQVLLRRKEMGDAGAGTTVITRYTLRLLTTQQFQRSATLICALELLRRKDEESLGNEPMTIGLWVGGGTTPNLYADAIKLLDDLRAREHPDAGFQLELCPWCGTEVIPATPTGDDDWGIRATNNDFRMNCPNKKCPFHARLPVSVVDEHLYEHPPTFLIATIDKFARLTWDERSGVFLGAGDLPGPSLIIQDELHLVSGPLGTVAALYETAIDLLITRSSGRPKVVASTATIKRAHDQVKGLFDREVFLFPPSGMSHDDSYFVHFDHSVPGRRYVGVMAQSHTPTTANVHTSAAVLQAPLDLGLSGTSLDAYWTLVAYHNSLRELGKTVTLARDDIPDRIRTIAENTANVRQLDRGSDVEELTSNIPSREIPKILELLGHDHASGSAVSVVACTNMISVGVDVPRLSLMLVNGQPKSTSEYIQATSRVGRDANRPPGLVVALLSSAKPRDRSHYESFKPYHRAIYREVEPTSVTPWALPARERALHATLVILARHLLGLPSNTDAENFLRDQRVDQLIDHIVARATAFDQREAPATRRHLERLVENWQNEIARPKPPLRYRAESRTQKALMRRYGSKFPGLWPTLDSMRNVDVDVLVRVRGEQS